MFLELALTLTCTAVPVPLQSPDAPVKEAIDDVEITDAVEGELLLDAAVAANGIDVETKDGIVVLRGEVDNALAARRAVRIAETVKGVRSVIGRVEVDPSPARTDEEVLRDVRRALLDDPATDLYELDVKVHDGEVFLDGTVQSFTEKELCETVALGVAGVKGLKESVRIEPAGTRPESEIEQEVEAALRWNTLVDDALIEVDVTGDTVRLDGIVGSAAEKRQARYDAWTTGVRAVDDSGLTVARWARDPDLRAGKYASIDEAELEAALDDALELDPRVAAFDVEADVSGSLVTLRGVVDNLKAKRAAERDALGTVGISRVRNHLKVRPAVERSDEAIRRDVVAALERDPFVERAELAVHVDDGIVRLQGAADSFFEKGHADDLAARVNGVTDVVNEVGVVDRPRSYLPFVDGWDVRGYSWYHHDPVEAFASDWIVTRDIERELFWSPFVDSEDVDVEVQDGTATLTGTVDSWLEWGAARDNAYEGGATRVQNRIAVESSARADG